MLNGTHKSLFQEVLKQNIDNCIAQAKIAHLTEHSGLCGELREILISNVLNSLLPDGFGIGTGKIADCKGNLSSQTDIIIYNKSKFPPILFEKVGFFPIESVVYAIEVKSTLNLTELNSTIRKADLLKNLYGRKPHYILFAFNSDLKDQKSDLNRMNRTLSVKDPALNIYCITGRLYGYFGQEKWNHYGYTEDHYEIVSMIIGILNTLLTWQHEHGSITPGHYFGIE